MKITKIRGNQVKRGYYINDNPKDISGNPLPKVPAMVSACVSFYRKKMMPLKTIYLCPLYYTQFTDWFRRLCLEHEADLKADMLTWDGVNIDMMDKHHIIKSRQGNDEFDYDFYPLKPQNEIN